MKKGTLQRGWAGVIGLACWWLVSCDRHEAAGEPAVTEEPLTEVEGVKTAPAAGVLPETGDETQAAGTGVSGPATGAEEGDLQGAAVAAARIEEKWSLEHAGFAAHLPAETSFYAEARQLDWTLRMAGQLNLLENFKGWMERLETGVEEAVEEGAADDVAEEAAEEIEDTAEGIGEEVDGGESEGLEVDLETMLAWGEDFGADAEVVFPALFGEDAFVAAVGLDTPYKLLEEYTVMSNRWMGSFFTEFLARGEFGEAAAETDEMFKELAGAVGETVEGRIEEADGRLPMGVLAGGRVSDASKRAEVLQHLRDWLAKAADSSPGTEPRRFEKHGTTWEGIEVGFPDPSSLFESEGFKELGSPEVWENIIRTAAGWKVVMACGVVDDYVVLYTGLGEYSLRLAEEPAKSLAAEEAFGFCSEFGAQAVYGTLYVQRELIESYRRMSTYLHLFRGIEEGLQLAADLELGGEMLETLRELNGHWAARRKGVSHDLVGLIVVDGGLRLESRGGWEDPGLDLDTPLQLTKAFEAMDDDLLLRLHWRRNEDFIDHGRKRTDAGIRLLQLTAREVMDQLSARLQDGEDAEDGEEGEEAPDFDRWRKELVDGIEDVWKGYREHFVGTFGPESALVVDLDGTPPAAFGVAEEAIEGGKIPRVAYVRPVIEREALGETWELWNRGVTNLFGILSDATETPVPFPDTMSADKDDLTTYFFTFPFASDDFLPSVSVSDEIFIVGSSKLLSERIYEEATKPNGPAEKTGVWLELNMDPFWSFCEAWIDVKEEDWEQGLEIEEDERLRAAEENEKAADADDGDADLDALSELLERELEKRPPVERVDEAPERLELPNDAEENPLLDELEKDDAADDAEPEFRLEMDAEELELFMDEDQSGIFPGGIFGLFDDGDGTPAGELRAAIGKMRWFRGLSYRSWLDDGVPRRSGRIKWARPGDPRP